MKNIINNIVFRFGGAISFFLISIIVSRVFGAEAKGEISLFILNSTIIQLVIQLLTGTSLSYYFPKIDNKKLYQISWLWNGLVSIISYIVLAQVTQFEDYALVTAINAFITSAVIAHQNIFLAKKNINWYSYLLFFPHISVFLIIFLGNFFFQNFGIENVMWSYNAGFLLWAFISYFPLKRIFDKSIISSTFQSVFKQTFGYGLIAQLANTAQLLANRVSLYIILLYVSKFELGIYSNAIAIMESILLITRGTASVLYSNVLNNNDSKLNYETTRKWSFNIMLLTFVSGLVICFFPDGFYTYIFGKEFTNIQMIILYLFLGITAQSFSSIISNYFGAVGLVKYNTYGSVISFLVVLVLSFILVPEMGINGAALATTFAYISMALFLFFLFKKQHSKIYSTTEN